MSDGELVRLALGGDNAAFERLVRCWTPRVLAVCHARVGRADAAEELAQEALVRGYRALRSLSEPEKFGAWLCGIATRVSLDWIRKNGRAPARLSELDDSAGVENLPDRGNGAADADREDDLRRLMDEVQRLPEKLREALMLYYYKKGTYEELAGLLGVSAATVNARLTQARQMLRQRLGVGPSKAASE